MLLSHFIRVAEKTLTGIVFALLCTLAASYFGEPEIFDPLIMLVVIITALIFRQDKNLLSLLAIIALVKIIEEVTWLLFDNSYTTKIPLYLLMLGLVPWFSSGWLKGYLLAFIGCAVAAEVYWYVTDYPAPWIYWQVWMCCIAAVARRATAVRVSWMIDLTGSEKIDFLKLDYHLFNAFGIFIFFYSITTLEYYIRHMLGFHEITFVYYLVEYFSSTFACFVMYMIIVESIKQINRANLPA